jgi:hypothetical protein
MNVDKGNFNLIIDDEWITESGLKPFSKTTNHYHFKLKKDQSGPVMGPLTYTLGNYRVIIN